MIPRRNLSPMSDEREACEPADLPETMPEGYRTQSLDTGYEFERLLFRELRRLPIWRKAEMLSALCRGVQEIALAGLQSRYPEADEHELHFRLAALRLDRETMVRVFRWDPIEKGSG